MSVCYAGCLSLSCLLCLSEFTGLAFSFKNSFFSGTWHNLNILTSDRAFPCEVVRVHYNTGVPAGYKGVHSFLDMLCYLIWLFIKHLSHKAIQRRSQCDRLVKMKVFKLRRDAYDIPCSITLRSAGGESFQMQDPPQQRPDSGIETYGITV